MDAIVNSGRQHEYARACVDFGKLKFGNKNVVSAVSHFDETTFHIHLTVVPIVEGPAQERPDTKKQHDARDGKPKRKYKKQEATARLCAKEVFTPKAAEQWQDDFVEFMHLHGFDFERGVHGSEAKHMDPAIYNTIKAEEAKLIAKKDGLEMQKEVLEDEVDSLQPEKDALTIEIETLNKEKRQAETAVKGLQTMCKNLTTRKTQLTSDLADLQSQLSEGKISLDEYNQKKANVEKQISNCDERLADKQKKLEQKKVELQDITNKVNRYDASYVRFDVPKNDVKPPKITERPSRLGNIDEWMKFQNASIKQQFDNAFKTYGERVMKTAQNCIVSERKLYLKQQLDMTELGDNLRREIHLRQQQTTDVADLLNLFKKPDTTRLVREVAIALMGGHYVSIPSAGGGSVSSETGWDGRKKGKEDENFRLRCWLHAAKTVKASQYFTTKRKGYGM